MHVSWYYFLFSSFWNMLFFYRINSFINKKLYNFLEIIFSYTYIYIHTQIYTWHLILTYFFFEDVIARHYSSLCCNLSISRVRVPSLVMERDYIGPNFWPALNVIPRHPLTRLTSEIASCSKGAATHSICCGIDLTPLSGETTHEKKGHFVRRRVLFAPATHFPRWNYSYHSEQNWRRNLWSPPECDVSHLSRKANLLMYSAFARRAVE